MNDPVNFVDPSGNCPGCLVGFVAGAIGGYTSSHGSLLATAIGAVVGAGIGAVAPTASLSVGALAGNAAAAFFANAFGQVLGNLSRTGDISMKGALDTINVPTLLLSPFLGLTTTGAAAVGTAVGVSELITGSGMAFGTGIIEGALSNTGNINGALLCK